MYSTTNSELRVPGMELKPEPPGDHCVRVSKCRGPVLVRNDLCLCILSSCARRETLESFVNGVSNSLASAFPEFDARVFLERGFVPAAIKRFIALEDAYQVTADAALSALDDATGHDGVSARQAPSIISAAIDAAEVFLCESRTMSTVTADTSVMDVLSTLANPPLTIRRGIVSLSVDDARGLLLLLRQAMGTQNYADLAALSLHPLFEPVSLDSSLDWEAWLVEAAVNYDAMFSSGLYYLRSLVCRGTLCAATRIAHFVFSRACMAAAAPVVEAARFGSLPLFLTKSSVQLFPTRLCQLPNLLLRFLPIDVNAPLCGVTGDLAGASTLLWAYGETHPRVRTLHALLNSARPRLDFSARDVRGRTALMLAALRVPCCGKLYCVSWCACKLLLSNCFSKDVANAFDNEGRTALMHALDCVNAHAAEAMLQSGLVLETLNARDASGRTALAYALQNATNPQIPPLLPLLYSHGAVP